MNEYAPPSQARIRMRAQEMYEEMRQSPEGQAVVNPPLAYWEHLSSAVQHSWEDRACDVLLKEEAQAMDSDRRSEDMQDGEVKTSGTVIVSEHLDGENPDHNDILRERAAAIARTYIGTLPIDVPRPSAAVLADGFFKLMHSGVISDNPRTEERAYDIGELRRTLIDISPDNAEFVQSFFTHWLSPMIPCVTSEGDHVGASQFNLPMHVKQPVRIRLRADTDHQGAFRSGVWIIQHLDGELSHVLKDGFAGLCTPVEAWAADVAGDMWLDKDDIGGPKVVSALIKRAHTEPPVWWAQDYGWTSDRLKATAYEDGEDALDHWVDGMGDVDLDIITDEDVHYSQGHITETMFDEEAAGEHQPFPDFTPSSDPLSDLAQRLLKGEPSQPPFYNRDAVEFERVMALRELDAQRNYDFAVMQYQNQFDHHVRADALDRALNFNWPREGDTPPSTEAILDQARRFAQFLDGDG